MPEPKMPTPENVEKIDKSRRKAAKELIDMGADYTIGAVGPEVEDKLKQEKVGEWTNTLGEWIKLNKTIACPRDFLNEHDQGYFDAKKRSFVIWSNKIYFIDKDGSIAAIVSPQVKQVGELQNVQLMQRDEWIMSKLEELGFVYRQSQLEGQISNSVARYQKHLEEQAKEKTVKEFDF